MFSPEEVAEYYNTTQNHYLRWWNLNKRLSLHYGIHDRDSKTFSESLVNTNRIMMEKASITPSDRVLDAGCGVGGAAIFINKMKNAEVTGISLSEKQIKFARESVAKYHPDARVRFEVMDFTHTSFPDNSFDVVWACESVCQADKKAFVKESLRILKKGGRMILADFFLVKEHQRDNNEWIRKWCDTWAVTELVTCDYFTQRLAEGGFSNLRSFDYTSNIKHSARRMYLASIFGAISSELYNSFHPGVSRFAKTHYKCGYFQYMALKEELWCYKIILAIK